METEASQGSPILIVDDDDLVGELLMLRLESAVHRPTWVKDGPAR